MDAKELLQVCNEVELRAAGIRADEQTPLMAAAVTLAAWVREQCQQDDGEEATSEWLESIGRDPETCAMPWDNCYGWRLCFFESSDPHFEYPVGKREWEDGPDIPNCRTRGAVRRLLTALGMEVGR